MNDKVAVVGWIIALCLSPLSASSVSARSASSLGGTGWHDADPNRASGGSTSHHILSVSRAAGRHTRTEGPAARVSVPDGAGGLYIAWADFRDGSADIFLLRVTNVGTVASGWPSDGVPVCSATGDQVEPRLVSDGSNGVIVGWFDFRDTWKAPDVYAQRVNLSGATQWTANGVELVAGLYSFDARLWPDGTGGVLAAWSRSNGTNFDVYATRLTSTGALATGWTAGGTLVCGLTGDQWLPVLTTDGLGGAILAWEDGRGAQTHVFAQRLNSTGIAQWGANGSQIDTSPTSVSSPAICSDGGTGALLFWNDFAGTEKLIGQRLDSGGASQWTSGGLAVPGTPVSQGLIGCLSDGLGGAIVGWEESPALDVSIHAQRLNGLGAQQWGVTAVTLVAVANSDPVVSDAVTDGSGGAFFVWEDHRNFATPHATPDLFAQKISSTGGIAWPSGGATISTSGQSQFAATCALDLAGGLLVAWLDQRSLDNDIYVQRFSSTAVAAFTGGGKPVFANPGVQVGQGILQSDAGGAFLFANEKRNGQWDIRGRLFGADGTPAGPSVAICSAGGHQTLEGAIDDGAGGAIVCWSDLRGGDPDIYVRRVDGSGTPQWTADGVPVCVAVGDQTSPRMVSDGAGGVFLSWQDARDPSNPDIYAQHVDNTGAATWAAGGVAVCADLGVQQGAALASDGAGGAIIAWTDLRNFLSPAVFAQRLNGSGNPQWTLNGESVASFSLLGSVIVSGVVTAPGSAAIILINNEEFDFTTGNVTSILYVQKVSSAGAGQWGPQGTLVCDAGSLCALERIVEDGAGGAFIAWADGRNDVFDIYARRVDSAGLAQWAVNGLAVCNAAGWQHLGGIARHSGGDLVLLWSDQRAGQPDLYAHRIGSAAGAAVWPTNGASVCGVARGQYLAALAPYRPAAPERYFVAWTDNRAGNERYVFLQRLDSAGNEVWTTDGETPTALALVSASAEPDRVHLVWYASEQTVTTIYRRTVDGDWIPIGEAVSDGSGLIVFDDRDVIAGVRYGYRLGFREDQVETFAGEVWVEVPTGLRFALDGLRPNPATEHLVVSFTLPSDDPATLEVLDVSGRRLVSRHLTGLPAGRHMLRLGDAPPPAGIYFVRLTQRGHSLTARAAVVH